MNLRTALLVLIYLVSYSFARPIALNAQSNEETSENIEAPVAILERDGIITVEWELSNRIQDDNILEQLSAVGWNNELLDDLTLPAFTFPALEASTNNGEPDIDIAIDTEQEWPHPIELQEMPDLVGPDGKTRPYVGPTEPIEELLPIAPVVVLREGLLRGEKRYVIAVSPVYFDGETIQVAAQGSARLTGFSVAEDTLTNDVQPSGNQPLAAPLSRPNSQQGQSPLTSPLALPTKQAANIPLTTTLSLPSTSSRQGIALTSPLALPTNNSQSVPLTTTLALPTSAPGRVPLNSPLALPTDNPRNVPLTQPLRLPSNQDQSAVPTAQQPTSPIATPTGKPENVPLNVPLTSPLTLPTSARAPATPTEAPTVSLDTATNQDDVEEDIEPTATLTAEPSATDTAGAATEATDLDTESVAEDNVVPQTTGQFQSAATPWTGLMTFAFFGVLLLAMLFTNRD